ncbi:endolytic transglycosylase MltG [Streptomyces sp. TRM70350]|uniref:endolytic transglycosylase MltG n=1 Tax=Streptomyces sp. TRM70350 TaxID=2856165 RepID=UPI001C486A68|nr:endolytic transglycosylase MltG [Streptomyces sp. TRM70350]MBV7695519.1 endolytic transglycosylase MltG [Streptomyces sp. TRM70350]
MTEYGRGQGSEPWHPEDPLYGDGGWGGQQAPTGPQSPYGGQPQHYPEQPQQPQYGDWGTGEQPGYGQAQQQYQQQYDQQQYAGQAQQSYDTQQQYDSGTWATGIQPHLPYSGDPTDPYPEQTAAFGGEQPDLYGTPDAYPPPEPPSRRRAEPEPRTDWDPGPDQGEHAFFSGEGEGEGDDDDEPGDRRGRGERRGRGGKGKKSRNGCACLVVALVFGGGLAGVTYFGYQFYQDRFGAAPDYAGDGTSEQVTVEVPKGASGAEIGRRLKAAGVVKSVDAFVAAQSQNPDGDTIQAGAYLLNKQMSAESAIEMMLDPKSQNNVMVTPGQRNVAVYNKIDEKLGLESGTTRDVAEKQYKSLGLPSWANNNGDIKDPLEGFLFPGTYPAAKGMKPEAVLREMVAQANRQYGQYDLDAKAKALNLKNPLQVITVASLVQAEGKTEDDFRKMAEVIYNRLSPDNTETYQLLQFDSTFNYLKGESNIHISEDEINSNQDPYNTYTQKGLPPGPIGNPGAEALKAALNPTDEGWLYFVATDGRNRTEFARTHDEFLELKDKFNESTGN